MVDYDQLEDLTAKSGASSPQEPIRVRFPVTFYNDQMIGELKNEVLANPFEVLPKSRPAGPGISGVLAHAVGNADEPFNSDIGALLPIALCGRTSL